MPKWGKHTTRRELNESKPLLCANKGIVQGVFNGNVGWR